MSEVILNLFFSAAYLLVPSDTIWVDDSNTDPPFEGTSDDPFQSITAALNQGSPATGDIIKVRAGTYDDALETFPLDIPDGVSVLGDRTGARPQLGGDAAGGSSSSVEAVIRIIANTANGNRSDIDLAYLEFPGEDTSGIDAPSAVLLRVADNKSISNVTIDSCVFERSEMNDSTHADRATITLENGPGSIAMVIEDNVIEPSAKGGIHQFLLDTSKDNEAQATFTVQRNTFEVTGTDTALFGIRIGAEGSQVSQNSGAKILENTFDGSNVTSGLGLVNAIEVIVDLGTTGSVAFHNAILDVGRNEITGCSGDGIFFRSDVDHADASAQWPQR